ncbi:MAG: dTDP-4-dehydrorhamnose reductase [Porticoccaceae bacterium]|nr:dTDP-4-dehydrorhamnose reductase [Porticoccaceae bacterium]
MMKVLVLGANGQLGRCLADQLADTNHSVTLASRAEIDLSNLEATRAALVSLQADVVINASAYTAVDKAEDETEQANLINNLAVGNVANVCADIGAVLVHVSTDYVFDGEATIPYGEAAATNPQGVYGQTKLLGEQAVQASGCKHLIIRTAWVFSEYGNNFLKTMLRLAEGRDSLSIVSDQVGCPTYAQDIAKAIVKILAGIESNNQSWGLYHFCGDQSTTWFGFADAIFEQAAAADLIASGPALTPISTAEFPTPAKRPAFSALDSGKIMNDWAVQSSDWMSAIKVVISTLKSI